jgi:hypothetical protein
MRIKKISIFQTIAFGFIGKGDQKLFAESNDYGYALAA